MVNRWVLVSIRGATIRRFRNLGSTFSTFFHNLARPWDRRMRCLAPHSTLSLNCSQHFELGKFCLLAVGRSDRAMRLTFQLCNFPFMVYDFADVTRCVTLQMRSRCNFVVRLCSRVYRLDISLYKYFNRFVLYIQFFR